MIPVEKARFGAGGACHLLPRGVALLALLALPWLVGCNPSEAQLAPGAGQVGVEPIPRVHLFENHSSALMAWRDADVRDRVVVHLDGHADFDWLPDETIARLAAAEPGRLGEYEVHPYAMDDRTLAGFSIWNFIYPAVRLGMVRELIWVVPDGTLSDDTAARKLVRERLVYKMQMISLDEARQLRITNGVIRGQILGTPVYICELADLPALDEPVLLDIDIDYFTTRSALSLRVTERPWIDPLKTLAELRDRGVRSDLVTLSLSTIGGYMPASSRWIGTTLKRNLREPGGVDEALEARRLAAITAAESGSDADAVELLEQLVAEASGDAALWYLLSRSLERLGDPAAAAARERAVAIDPVLDHDALFDADRLWINKRFAEALEQYDRYLERLPESPFRPYVQRRRASCLERTGRPREALHAWQQVLKLAPRHADSYLDYGLLLRELGMTEQALTHMRTAQQILPDRVTFATALGTTYVLQGRLEEGVQHLRIAARRQPCMPRVHGNLSAALVSLGRHQEAAEHLRLAMWLQPNNKQYRTLASQLDRQGIRVTPVAGP